MIAPLCLGAWLGVAAWLLWVLATQYPGVDWRSPGALAEFLAVAIPVCLAWPAIALWLLAED